MKKITAGVLAFSIIALLGVSLIAAFPFGFGKGMNQDLTEEEQIEAQAFHDSLQQAIEDGDFETWKLLMESQLTEENFNVITEKHQEMEENRAERDAYCEENECSNFQEKRMNAEGNHPGRGLGMETPRMRTAIENTDLE